MSKFLFYISFLLFSCNFQDEKHELKINCNKFKTGAFFNLVDGDTTLYRLDRSDTIQKETIVRTGEFVNLKIKWIGQCEYELSFLNRCRGYRIPNRRKRYKAFCRYGSERTR
jgi:hypothetical protein